MNHQDVNVVQVVNFSQRQRFSWLGALMLMGLIIWLWKWLLLVAVVAIIMVILYRAMQRAQLERSRRAEGARHLCERADQQHQWVKAGDPRGTYGPTGSVEDLWPPHGPVPKPAAQRRRTQDQRTDAEIQDRILSHTELRPIKVIYSDGRIVGREYL